MKLIKDLGIGWGTIYLVVGVLSSFTINNIHPYSNIVLLSVTFLLPLPLSIIAVWFPRIAGTGLILCVIVAAVIVLFLYGVKDALIAFPVRFPAISYIGATYPLCQEVRRYPTVIARPIAPMSALRLKMSKIFRLKMLSSAQGSPLWFAAWHTPIAASSRLTGMGIPVSRPFGMPLLL
jgi:hypothetical protein